MTRKLFLSALLVLFFVPGLWAQNSAGCPCIGNQPLQTSNIIVAEGKIDRFLGGAGQGMPSMVFLTAAGEKLTLQTAPYWFFFRQQMNLKAGDTVSVHFTKFNCNGAERWVALSIANTEGQELKLRDEKGCPLWAGGRGRGGRGGRWQ